MPPGDGPQGNDAVRNEQGIFSIPAPVKRLFDYFPLLSYPPNEPPRRSPPKSLLPTLYIFTTDKDARYGRPSFNPSCLRWQTYLKLCGVEFHTASSNNHSSPTGSLPFLLPPAPRAPLSPEVPLPITSNKLEKWARDRGYRTQAEDQIDSRHDAYLSLLDSQIRNAWLYALYLEPRNSVCVAQRLYVDQASSSTIVSKFLSHQLRTAAEAELAKHSQNIDVDSLYTEAERALEALSVVLGWNEYFFGRATPGLFDASVFAYTHLLLDSNMGWKEDRLVKSVQKWENLVQHRERILDRYLEPQQA
ncbi:MAG: hypothetical protein M1839_002271 [Geoglossum umbratile]|nr:MAG: hypothetical protein M1839_002271 [Geoglossum umbratile]